MLLKKLFDNFSEFNGKEVEISGWIKRSRFSKNVGFLEITDGSCFKTVQIVIDRENSNYSEAEHFSIYSAITVNGILKVTESSKQPFEIEAKSIELLAKCEEDYPLQNKRQTFEFLRTLPTLRPRTNTFQAVFRLRSEIAFALHSFFHERGFVYVHTPLITNTDGEGAGEMFRVTTLDANKMPRTKEGELDYSKDFFGSESFLTVTGQLEVEPYALAYRNVYTFGPTFRAEKSNTTRHAAEFWMVEPEIAFAELEDVEELAESMIKYVINHVYKTIPEEMEFFNNFIDKELNSRLKNVVNSEFKRMTYTEAIEILKNSNQKFEFPVEWGADIQSEHEKYLTEKVVGGPLFLTDYPKEIKSFYMRLNEDNKTVRCFDLLVPGIGELIGASQREERPEYLMKTLNERGMNIDNYKWYVDLMRFGGVKHGGFGVGFERLVMYLSGMQNIRDVIPYPRTVGSMKKNK